MMMINNEEEDEVDFMDYSDSDDSESYYDTYCCFPATSSQMFDQVRNIRGYHANKYNPRRYVSSQSAQCLLNIEL